MPSERIQRRIDALLDEADDASALEDWATVAARARAALAFDPENLDARAYIEASERALGSTIDSVPQTAAVPATQPKPATEQPTSFAGGRYEVRRFLGEGGKKRVFLAHDTRLDRNVAFALIKTEGLDATGRERITREAQAMGRLGTHPNVVSIYDLGEEGDAPYIVTELMGGGDVQALLEQADGALELTRSLEIAKGVASGLAFAHEHGIVHRDLKPGNVWLTQAGVPKIGDFGLAVSEGRSRLTQHGLMVGTFGYMPPEQALGHEANPRSDLYSFGAILYELVTGQPPFSGDTPTAVISQHLNSAPVAPSWHTEHCPPALEDLILALLAKEPGARPASASEVLSVLEGIDPTERSRSRSDSAANPLERLASGVFVGRERELERLRAALDGALSGRGSLVMLVGEPGIGKTRTTQELETYARMRGAKVLWGRAHESAGAPPYWPWVQVVRAYRDQTDIEDRRRQYQPYALELQRIFPALRELFPNLPEAPEAESESGRFRLYDALASFLVSVATETPLVLVLDDLHWSDAATLEALTHLSHELAHARVLVLGTYRDTDLDRRHPLSAALAELNREDLFTRIPLRGLSLAETEAYIRRTADVSPPSEFVRRIHDETEGNPFFLAEVVNLMTEEGTLASPRADVQIPEGVRQALGRRLDRLSEDANALLTTLAVVGREFDHALVLALSEHQGVTTLRHVEEALRARVLEETGEPGRYRFRHALMQQTLLEELSAARRVLLHGQIAEALLAIYGLESRDHLPELAQHYAESAVLNPAHAQLAASTLRRAAESAAAALAWDEAARLYERCLDFVTAADDRLGEDEGMLWLRLSAARYAQTHFDGGLEALRRAALLLGSRPELLSEVAMRIAAQVPPGAMLAPADLWDDVIARGNPPASIAYRLLAVLAYSDFGSRGAVAADRARQIASELETPDPLATFFVEQHDCLADANKGDFESALRRAESSRPLAEAAGALLTLLAPTGVWIAILGDLDRYQRQVDETIQARRAAGLHAQADNTTATAARFRWRRDGTAALSPVLERLPAGPSKEMLRAEIALEGGAPAEARALMPRADDPALSVQGAYGMIRQGLLCRILVADGDLDSARAVFGEWRDAFDVEMPFVHLFGLAAMDDALPALGDDDWLAQILDHYSRRTQMRFHIAGTSPDFARGLIALRLDRVDDAEGWFRTGVEWASKWGLDTIVGRNRFGLAEVAERRGDHAVAMRHLDAAGELFSRHGAKLYLDQVLAKKELLGA